VTVPAPEPGGSGLPLAIGDKSQSTYGFANEPGSNVPDLCLEKPLPTVAIVTAAATALPESLLTQNTLSTKNKYERPKPSGLQNRCSTAELTRLKNLITIC
jgi:hypothetical protein